MTEAELLAHFSGVRRSGAGWIARCPAHEDARASLSIARGEKQPYLLICHAGCALDAILSAAGLEPADIMAPTKKPALVNGSRHVVAEYRYCDERGGHLFDVVRFAPKDFRQRAVGGAWSIRGVRRVLYRLPDLQGGSMAWIVEGEKDADRLAALGLTATCNPGGAGKWRDDDTRQLVAAGVTAAIVLPDNDAPGRTHAATVAASCRAAGLEAKVLELPGLPAKGDVSDWLDVGHVRKELEALAAATPIWQPPPIASASAATDLALTGLGDLLAEPDDAIDWLVEDRFAYGSVNLLAGKPKAGKSTLARYLAFCIATGSPFIGHRTMPGGVWYLVLEDKRSEVRRHFRALGATGTEPIRFVFGGRPDLLGQLARLAERERPAAIIVDTLQRLIGAKDLNDYAEVTTKLTPILALARSTGAALVLVHHAGKADRAGIDTVLGSTALAGSVDNIFLVNRTDRYRLLSTIQRIGPDLPETVLTLDAAGRTDAGVSRHEADVAHLSTAMAAALVAAGGELTRADWLDACEGRRQVKLEALRRLVESGTIIRLGAGSKVDPYRYRVRHDGDSGSQVPSNSREPESSVPLFSENANRSRQDCGSQVPAVPGVPTVPTGTTIERPRPAEHVVDEAVSGTAEADGNWTGL